MDSGIYELDEQTVRIPVDEIRVGVNIKNIRTVFDDDQTRELAESIYKDGLMNPLVVMVTQDADGSEIVELVCGARRLRAIQHIQNNFDADWNEGAVKCTQFTGSLKDATLLNGKENIERAEVDDVDTCAWLFGLVEDHGYTQDDLAEQMHRSAQWVSARITVHRKGSEKLKQALREKLISFTVAYELAKQLSAEEQDKRIDKARKNNEKLTLSEAEVAGDVDRVARPSKKRLAEMLSRAEQASGNPAKRNAHGVAMGLRYVLGLATEDEVTDAILWEEIADQPKVAEPEVEAPAAPEPTKAEEPPKKRRGRKAREE